MMMTKEARIAVIMMMMMKAVWCDADDADDNRRSVKWLWWSWWWWWWRGITTRREDFDVGKSKKMNIIWLWRMRRKEKRKESQMMMMMMMMKYNEKEKEDILTNLNAPLEKKKKTISIMTTNHIFFYFNIVLRHSIPKFFINSPRANQQFYIFSLFTQCVFCSRNLLTNKEQWCECKS